MKKAPQFLKKYFWDIDFSTFDTKKSQDYVIVRLLEYGDVPATKWLLKTFSKEDIKKVVITKRNLSPQTASFWSLFLGIKEKDVVCLQKPYLKMRQAHWPY